MCLAIGVFNSTQPNSILAALVIYYMMSKMIQSPFAILSLNLYQRKAIKVLNVLGMVIGRAFGKKLVAFIHLRSIKQLILEQPFFLGCCNYVFLLFGKIGLVKPCNISIYVNRNFVILSL